MIFVILGTQKIPFTRLLRQVDELIAAENIRDEVIAQSGHTEYQARNFRCIPFLSEEDFRSYIDKASVVITHSGSGSIYSRSKTGRILYPFCDTFIVQWPELLDVYGDKAEYFGTFV